MGKNNMIIPLSFKDDERWLYDLIKSHSGYSSLVKDILKEHFKNQNSNNNKPIITPSNIPQKNVNDDSMLDEINQIWKKE